MLFVAFCLFNISALIVTFRVVFRRLCSFSIVSCCVCFFSALNRCFSYCLLSFACLDGLFYVIYLSLPLIAHFCLFFVRFVSCLSFFALLAVVLVS